MIESTRNQLANVRNPYQGDRKKVLCVCSAGLLRSPTMAAWLSEVFNYNTRACGTSKDYALIPVSEALLHWADEVHVVKEQASTIKDWLSELNLADKPVKVFDIPDSYNAFSPELIAKIARCYGVING